MKNLWMVMLGGRHAKANTEVHDVVFAIGATVDDTYDQLKDAWFAEQKGLHIDAWAKVFGASGLEYDYRIEFHDFPTVQKTEKLWLINLGGYDADTFGELHRYILVVADCASEAKKIGKLHYEKSWQKPHTDRVIDVDDCIEIQKVQGQYLHLVKGDYPNTIWQNTYVIIN